MERCGNAFVSVVVFEMDVQGTCTFLEKFVSFLPDGLVTFGLTGSSSLSICGQSA